MVSSSLTLASSMKLCYNSNHQLKVSPGYPTNVNKALSGCGSTFFSNLLHGWWPCFLVFFYDFHSVSYVLPLIRSYNRTREHPQLASQTRLITKVYYCSFQGPFFLTVYLLLKRHPKYQTCIIKVLYCTCLTAVLYDYMSGSF